MSKYDQLLAESINQPKEFWSRMALKTLLWDEPFTKQRVLKGCDMSKGKIHWFDGKLNASGMFGCNFNEGKCFVELMGHTLGPLQTSTGKRKRF